MGVAENDTYGFGQINFDVLAVEKFGYQVYLVL